MSTAGTRIGGGTHWVMAGALTWTFPVFAAKVGGWALVFFGAMMLLIPMDMEGHAGN